MSLDHDGRPARARHGAQVHARTAEALLSRTFADPPDTALAAQTAIAHALLAVYWELYQRSDPVTISTTFPRTAMVAGTTSLRRRRATEPGS